MQNQFFRIAGTLRMYINNELKRSLLINDDKNVMFDVNEYDHLHVGHAPDTSTTTTSTKNRGIPGCIKDIVFNDYKIGLWNFYDTRGNCGGCTRYSTIIVITVRSRYFLFLTFCRPPDTVTNNCKRFKGNGYSYLLEKHQKDYNPTEISLQFSIRTFDEDALIFLAVHLQDVSKYLKLINVEHVPFV